MRSKKFKYQNYIREFSNCPPKTYKEREITAFRWVYIQCQEESFKPVLIIDPARQLGDEDKTCEGYALSMFLLKDGAYQKYKKLVSRKPHLKDNFGTMIAEIQLNENEGVSSAPEVDNFTHFNFHEYEGTILSEKVVNIADIFDENGNFKW